MADIATLGLRIDSSQAATAATALDKFAASGAKADAAASRLTTGASKQAAQFAALDKLQKLVDANHSKLAASGAAAGKGLAKVEAGAGLARHELINLSRQAQDVFVSIAGGQSILTVFFQQGSQIGDIFGSTTGTLRGFGAQLKSLISPTLLIGTGLVALGAAAIAATFSWRNFALALDDVSRQAGVTTSDMAKLQAAASFKGISADEFSTAMGKFSQNVYEAKNNMGGLADLLRANGSSARTFEQSFEKVADLVARASSDQQRLVILQQAGLPATMQWVRLLSSGKAGLEEARRLAVDFGGAANDNMVLKAREFDEAWNKVTTNFGLRWRSVFVDVATGLGNLIIKAREALISIGVSTPQAIAKNLLKDSPDSANRMTLGDANAFYGAFGKRFTDPNAKPVVDPNKARNDLALEQQRLGILGEMATVEQRVAMTTNAIALARLNGVTVTTSEQKALENLARAQAETDRVQQQASIGIFNFAAASKAAADTMQSWIDRKLIDPKNMEQMAAATVMQSKALEQLRQSAAVAAAPLEQLKRLQLDAGNIRQGLDQLATGSLRSLEDNLVSIVDGTKSVSQAFKDMIKSILSDLARLLIRQMIIAPLAGALQAGLGGLLGGGGVLAGGAPMGQGGVGHMHAGGIVGGAPTFSKHVHPAYFENAPRFHSGGIAGNEVPIVAQRGEGIFTPAQMKALGGARQAPVNVNVINNASGVQATPRQNPDGSIDVVIDQVEARMAGRVARGKGPLPKAIDTRVRPTGLRG